MSASSPYRLGDILSPLKIVDQFISALEQLGQPDAIFKDWAADMEEAINKGDRDEIGESFFLSSLRNIRNIDYVMSVMCVA